MRFKSTGAGASGSEYKLEGNPSKILVHPVVSTTVLITASSHPLPASSRLHDLNVKSHKKVSKYVTDYQDIEVLK